MTEDMTTVKNLKTKPQREKIEEPETVSDAMVITVTNPEGAGGDSLYGLNLATFLGLALKQTNKTVCFVDADQTNADVSKMVGSFYPTVSELNNEDVIDEKVVNESLVHRREFNLTLLLSETRPDRPRVSAETYEQAINVLKKQYDYVIVNSPQRANDKTALNLSWLLENSEHLLLTVLSTSGNLERSRKWLDGNFNEKMSIIRLDAEGWGAKNEIEQTFEEFTNMLSPYPVTSSLPSPGSWRRRSSNYQLEATQNVEETNKHFKELLFALTKEPVLLEEPKHVNTDSFLRKLLRVFTG